ncbi:MAG: LPS assembly protein LptD [Gammaproteobacteria bacterium]|nr:LPS assembly protein LptD [Gammaproteobacteria bacterium]
MHQTSGIHKTISFRIYVLLFLAFVPATGSAVIDDEQWGLCKPRTEANTLPSDLFNGQHNGETILSADEAEILNRDIVLLRGDIRARQTNQYLRADSATYWKTSDQLHAEGHILYFNDDLAISGENAELSLGRNTGIINETSYDLPSRHARGTAEAATIESKDLTILSGVTYTTCDIEDNAWLLRSSKLRLDQNSGVGTAKNVMLSFKRVPFFYFPYISFPIDDRRKSGFLTPSYAHSNDNGTEFTLPYYINLAPQFDATLTPRLISKRGSMITSELRYLSPINRGQLDLEYLPGDDLAGKDRSLFSFQNMSRFTNHLSSNIDIVHVSDTEYFRELGNSLSLSSITHLRQLASLDYRSDLWTSAVRLENYQTVDDTIPDDSKPYQRLPQLLFRTIKPDEDGALNYNVFGEYVDFKHDDRISGRRIDLQPSIEYPFRSLSAFLTPTIRLRQTLYTLNSSDPLQDSRPSRTVPSLSMDSGVFLERDSQWGTSAMIHTLEPRLYYLYSPFREQTDIPLFDTALPDFSYSQLFRNNRFSGNDRVGDANQISMALTTRFFEKETGSERLRASIGRIFYFKDREVSLNNQPETESTSDVVAESVASILPKLTSRLDVRWNQESRKIDKGSVHLQYMPNAHSIFNIAYRYRESELEQSDISFLWPLGRHWHIIGRRNYSLLDHRALETLAGLEYQSCCWRTQLVNRRYINDDLGETRENLYIQFELKGLTSIGDSLESVLGQGILGYEN